jgi:hypothetical protein
LREESFGALPALSSASRTTGAGDQVGCSGAGALGPGITPATERPAGNLGTCGVASFPLAGIDAARGSSGASLASPCAIPTAHTRLAVALVDEERTRLVTIVDGAIEDQWFIRQHPPTRHARVVTGGLPRAQGDRNGRTIRRHMERTVEGLLALWQIHPFERLLLAGSDQVVALLLPRLPRALRGRLVGRVSLADSASDADILHAAIPAAANECAPWPRVARIHRSSEITADPGRGGPG